MTLEVAILGPVEPRMNGDLLGVPAGKQRALLALLAVRAPHPVSAESAAEALWPRAAPAEAMRSLQVTVSRLRRSLADGGAALETVASGYRLVVEADAIDARRFETLVDAAQAAGVEGDAAAARRLLDDALGLWRGPALADVGFESFAQAEIARLEELRVAALEERIDARLSQGEHALVVAELEQLTAEHPSRERLVGLLMLALYRCGRQSDALAVYARGRLRLDEELGLEPSPELQRLQQAILRHDPSLDVVGGAAARRAKLPSGTVTFLFSDIEGSTRLLTRLRGRYAEVLSEHQRLLRAAFDEHDGREVHTEGDAFYVAFVRASDAIAAAVSAQRSLASQRWPGGVDVRVRMGVHTGEAELRQDDYVGLDVHRAARICAAGHGGQVLISSSTRELVADELPDDVALRDLGEHRLKDLDRPEQLFQLVVGDLPAVFPAPASLSPGSGAANGLPPSPNRTIGRENDVRSIADRLGGGGVRMLTLTGPGGVGKTRLALEAARAVKADFADGAYFVSLAALRRSEDVPAAVVRTLAIHVLSGEPDDQAAERFLAAKRLLLVLDNFEHVLAAAPFVGRLLSACPALSVLVTSREPLSLHAEERYPVSPLALPARAARADADALAGVDAVALFCARARTRDPGFELDDANAAAVAEICRRVDGLPLAIELAAARCGLLSPDEIAQRLHDALGALGSGTRDAPARQQTLRATIDWSYELLSDAEKQCAVRFAVFAGGATVQAAETITRAGLDTLDSLAAKSLLVGSRDTHTPTRLVMLETIRAYAGERFALATDKDAVHQRHYENYLALARRHGTERALWGAGGTEHLTQLDAEIDNMHAALGWAIAQSNAERALALAAALGRYWIMRGRHAEAVDWVERALNLPGADAHPAPRVRALCTKVRCLWLVGRGAEQPAALATAEAIARRLGDPVILSQALQLRVDYETNAERLDVADALADEALHWARAAGDDWEIAEASHRKAIAATTIADLRERVDSAASLLTDVGNVHQLADMLTSAAYAALCLGADRDATDLAARATPIARALDSRVVRMVNSGNVGLAALLTGETDTASRAFREELTLCREMVVRPQAFEGLRGLAAVAVMDGDDKHAATLVGAAEAQRYDTPEDQVEARLDETFFEPARTRCGTDAWDAATREGSALSFEDAIAYALEEPRA
jgi:predicted ATPase/DNA-binding SARP family transcriptional activator